MNNGAGSQGNACPVSLPSLPDIHDLAVQNNFWRSKIARLAGGSVLTANLKIPGIPFILRKEIAVNRLSGNPRSIIVDAFAGPVDISGVRRE